MTGCANTMPMFLALVAAIRFPLPIARLRASVWTVDCDRPAQKSNQKRDNRSGGDTVIRRAVCRCPVSYPFTERTELSFGAYWCTAWWFHMTSLNVSRVPTLFNDYSDIPVFLCASRSKYFVDRSAVFHHSHSFVSITGLHFEEEVYQRLVLSN